MCQSPVLSSSPLDRETVAELPADNLSTSAATPSPTAQCHTPSARGSCFPKTPSCQPTSPQPCADDPLNLVADGMALLYSERNRGGRPRVVDEQLKGKMVILLATGLSLRQTAAFLGISHPTVSAAIAADPGLAADIADARVRAELHPLAQLIREGGRSWKTAVWLLDYLEKRNEREQTEEEQARKQAKSARAAADAHSPPAARPMPESERSRIAAIRAQRPPRKRRAK